MIPSRFYSKWFEQVILPPENDYLICVSASSKTPVSGTGKTTVGAGICEALDRSPGPWDAEACATLSADEFANEVIPNAPDRGAVLMDESQGTPGAGSGLNRMRAMKTETMEAVGSVLANRDKNLTIVIIVQQFGMLFSDFYPVVDSWFLISAAPGQVGGPQIRHHRIYTDDYPDAGGGMRTPIVETLSWPALAEDHAAYDVLDRKKQESKTKGSAGSEKTDNSLSDGQQKRLAQSLRAEGWTLREIAEHDMIEYSYSWVNDHTEKPEKQGNAKAEATA